MNPNQSFPTSWESGVESGLSEPRGGPRGLRSEAGRTGEEERKKEGRQAAAKGGGPGAWRAPYLERPSPCGWR